MRSTVLRPLKFALLTTCLPAMVGLGAVVGLGPDAASAQNTVKPIKGVEQAAPAPEETQAPDITSIEQVTPRLAQPMPVITTPSAPVPVIAAPSVPVSEVPVPVVSQATVPVPVVTVLTTLTPSAPTPVVAYETTITPTIAPAAAPEPQMDQAQIQNQSQDQIDARDGRMLDALTTQTIADIIRQGLENDGETTSAEREAAQAFYAARDYAPIFLSAGALNHYGQAVLSVFKSAEDYGLNAADFENTAFLEADGRADNAQAAANADIGMALWALRYARHATTGRVNPASIASDITLERNFVDAATVLPALVLNGDPQDALLAYHPPHAQFHALRERLAMLRDGNGPQRHEPIAEGGTMRLGDSDERVPQLRARLGVPDPIITASIAPTTAPPAITPVVTPVITQRVGAPGEPSQTEAVPVVVGEQAVLSPVDPNQFDAALDAAIKTFQADHNLTADGIVGPATFAALNEQAGDLTPHIIANMERWRWMPRDLGTFHVIANVPEYRLWVRRNEETVFTTRTVVGRERHRTAIFSDEMEYIAVNPFWNVPASITRNELLPRIMQDPGYLSRANYEVIYNGRSIDPYAVNWEVAASQGLPRIRQRPGSNNALGEIKFMFPNQHAIYFHDTPSRGLFSRDQRAFSHGCVRVLDPWAFAQALLTNEPDWDLERIRSLRGSRERNVMLDEHIQVHITYFTARVDDDGQLIMARDLYGHHGRVLAALGFAGS